MPFTFHYEAERVKVRFGHQGPSSPVCSLPFSAHHFPCFPREMSFDFAENEFKAEGPCGLHTLDHCHGILHFTFDLKIEITWLPKNGGKSCAQFPKG